MLDPRRTHKGLPSLPSLLACPFITHLTCLVVSFLSVSLPVICLTVSPVCRSSQKTTYGVGRNEVVHVSCDVDADPSNNVSFKWHINNSDVSTDLKSFTSNGSHSDASFSATNPRSYGKLMCWAENSIGRQREPCVYNVVPASKTLFPFSFPNLFLYPFRSPSLRLCFNFHFISV